MGDRGNIVMQWPDNQQVCFYTHWGGSEIKEIVAQALNSKAGKGRWGDPIYLARIVFEHLRDESETDPVGEREAGYGISPDLGYNDNEHEVVYIDVKDLTVREGHGLNVSFEEWIGRFLPK